LSEDIYHSHCRENLKWFEARRCFIATAFNLSFRICHKEGARKFLAYAEDMNLLEDFSDSDLFQNANGGLPGGSIITIQQTNTQVTYTILVHISHKITPLKTNKENKGKQCRMVSSWMLRHAALVYCIFMNAAMWEHCNLTMSLDVAKFTTLTPLSLLISCKLSFPIVGLKMSSLPTLAFKSPNKIFVWYLGNLSNIRSKSS
jgi:hypothetical protein